MSGDQIIDPPQVVDGGGGGGSSSSSDGGGTDFVAGVRNSGFIYAYAEAFDPGAGEAGAGEAEAEGILIDRWAMRRRPRRLLTVRNDAGAIVTEAGG